MINEKTKNTKCDKCRADLLVQFAKASKDDMIIRIANEITRIYDVLIAQSDQIARIVDKMKRSL
jgi:hypothetical protein